MSGKHLPVLATTTDQIPERILVVGDPARVDLVANSLTAVQQISQNREYKVIRGEFDNEEIGVVSHGVGSAGAGVCFEELCQAGARRIIRCGSAGGLRADINAGDVVILTGAVREDGLSRKLVPETYPAIASADMVIAMRHVATEMLRDGGRQVYEGLGLTSDLFYPHDILGSDLVLWQKSGLLAVEMECSTLFVICSLHGVESGAVLAIDGNPLQQDEGSMETYNPRQESVIQATQTAIKIALTATAAA